MNDIAIRVEAVPEHGMATIWDADVLIWAASQIVEARDAGLRTSRLMAATPHEILTFIGRGTSARDYHRLKAALDRLQSTTVATSLRQIERAAHASLLLDQRMDGARRRAWQCRRHRSDRAGLVLSRGPRRCARADDRPRIFRPDGRPGALALSPRAQACAAASATAGGSISGIFTSNRRAFRRSNASPSNCATSSAASRCRGTGSSSSARPADASCWPSRTRNLSTDARGQAVEAHVLSGTDGHVPSGTGPSCYQEPKQANSSKPINRFRAA